MDVLALQTAFRDCDLVSRFFFYEKIDSTMKQGRRLVEGVGSDVLDGTLIVADFQSEGRGRHGREWVAPGGVGVLATLLVWWDSLPVCDDGVRMSLLSASVPVAVCEGLRGFVPGVRIKYPNDVVVGGRKLGGVLLERCGGYVLVGFGVNCWQGLEDFSVDLRMPASSLFLETGRRVSREDVLVAVLEELAVGLGDPGFWGAGDRMNVLCESVGGEISLDLGGEVLTGVADSIMEDGGLMLRTGAGVRKVFSTEVVRTWSRDEGRD